MDVKDENKKEEDLVEKDGDNLSLDDMMAAAVTPDAGSEVSTESTTEEDAVKAETPEENESTEAVATESKELSDRDLTAEPASAADTNEETSIEANEEVEETSGDIINEANIEADEKAKEDVKENQPPIAALPARKDYKGKWYIVHTYSGHENKVARTLMQRVQAMGFEERIYDALVPTRDTIRVRGGKKETIKEKIFPGYILVNMDLSDEAWVLVRTTPGVTSFVGAQNKPTPIRDDEVQAIVAFVGQKDPVYKAQFSLGEAVKITDGPFSDFLGTIESIDEAKGQVKVLVSIFGRETPVELDFLQVAKI